jgi:xanthine dehydrogenase YagT iron-sulfur-binding subunit
VPRRGFLIGAGAAAVGSASVGAAAHAGDAEAARSRSGHVVVELTVNGDPVRLSLDARVTLLDALRERLDLTGTKKGCDRGQCGACTVHVDGRRVLSCLTLAAAVDGKRVTTIEGLAKPGGALHPVQQAFVDRDGLQCGFCTPGQIMSATALEHEEQTGSGASDAEIRELMSGNLCRCGAYNQIVEAIQSVRTGRGGGEA